ncbi:MAG: heparinase II/III domain-containing protein [Gemmatimonadaceae bacterium]
MTAGELLGAAPILWRTYGARGLRQRALFELSRIAGRFRTEPGELSPAPGKSSLPPDWRFAPNRDRVRATSDHAAALLRADRVLAGEHQAYRWTWMPRPQTATAWRTHPVSGFEYDARAPWFRIAHFDPRAGDIKDVWEPGRFAWSYDLARGYLLTGDDRYAECFWQGFETFLDGCPPFRGVQWSCGQETAIRATAWLWTEAALLDAPASSPARLARLREALAWSAERIADAIGYAISQRNNHGISEAAGLVMIGARLHAVHPRARRWRRSGSRWLEGLVQDQFATDGWYIQHSFNYLRVALDQLVLAQGALESRGQGLSPAAVRKLRAAVHLLGRVINPLTGAPPLHGANDGSYVLPLSTRPYRDFVPSLTAAASTFHAPLPHALCADEETLAWLGRLAPPREEEARLPALNTGSSGWFSVATSGARVFARAGEYHSRPGHIDPLHLDVSIEGRAVATDAGTYRYSAPPPWANGLAEIDVHNTLTIVGHPPARRGPRFLWLAWPSARIVESTIIHDELVRVVMENTSWGADGILHKRTCEIHRAGVTVLDEVSGPSDNRSQVRLQWLIDGPATDAVIAASSPVTIEATLGDERSVLGWISDGYGDKRRATSVRVSGHLESGRLRIITVFGEQRSANLLQTMILDASPVRTAECST